MTNSELDCLLDSCATSQLYCSVILLIMSTEKWVNVSLLSRLCKCGSLVWVKLASCFTDLDVNMQCQVPRNAFKHFNHYTGIKREELSVVTQ